MTDAQILFDVFLAHNSKDKQYVRYINGKLKRSRLKTWLDEEAILAGQIIQEEIQKVIPQIKSAAIFIGTQGLGRWQKAELRSFYTQCVEKGIIVIPVLLPSVSEIPPELVFLREHKWVSFTNGIEDKEALEELKSAIKQRKLTRKRKRKSLANTSQLPPDAVVSNSATDITETSTSSKNDILDFKQNYQKPKMHILHISDLRFSSARNALNLYNRLADDLKHNLGCSCLDALILSGDIANNSTSKEYDAVKQFLRILCKEFQLDSEQLVIVPGNHDLNWRLAKNAYCIKRREDYKGPLDETGNPDKNYAIYQGGAYVEVQSQKNYKQRFKHFCAFYEAIKGKTYPLEYEQQAILHHFPKHNLLILGFNSAWQLDHHYTSRIGICRDAFRSALNEISQNSEIYQDCLKFAVWHHPLDIIGEDSITNLGFIQSLAQAGFCVVFHGHIHEREASLYRRDLKLANRQINIVGAGTFGTPVKESVLDYPLQYNLLKLESNKLIVETRYRREPDRAWEADAIWTQGDGKDSLPRYEILLPKALDRITLEAKKSNPLSFHASNNTPTPTSQEENTPSSTVYQQIPNEQSQTKITEPDLSAYREHLEEVFKTKQPSAKTPSQIKKVLILAVCPKSTSPLRLDEEVREICQLLRKSTKIRFIVDVRWAVRVDDLYDALLEVKPNILHFSGHGSGEEGIVLEDATGNIQFVSPESLVDLFQLFSNEVECFIECVNLNACYTSIQAEAIAPYVGYVIGMSRAIGDKAAIQFAKGFFRAIAHERSIDFAFKLGCNAIKMQGIPEHLTPIIKKSNLSFPFSKINEEISEQNQQLQEASKRILVLTANPKNTPTLRLDEEVREIYTAMKQAMNDHQVFLEQRWAARYTDIEEALLHFQPHIVHFSGHGEGEEGLVFEDEIGNIELVRTEIFSSLFEILGTQVECVVLNANYSEIQALALAQHIQYTIGMPSALTDQASIAFTSSFYRTLATNNSFEIAYRSGCIAMQRKNVSNNDLPVLHKKSTPAKGDS